MVPEFHTRSLDILALDLETAEAEREVAIAKLGAHIATYPEHSSPEKERMRTRQVQVACTEVATILALIANTGATPTEYGAWSRQLLESYSMDLTRAVVSLLVTANQHAQRDAELTKLIKAQPKASEVKEEVTEEPKIRKVK